jgi:hypothetical protein
MPSNHPLKCRWRRSRSKSRLNVLQAYTLGTTASFRVSESDASNLYQVFDVILRMNREAQ